LFGQFLKFEVCTIEASYSKLAFKSGSFVSSKAKSQCVHNKTFKPTATGQRRSSVAALIPAMYAMIMMSVAQLGTHVTVAVFVKY